MIEVQIEVRKLNDSAIVPQRMTEGAAGFDLYAAHYVAIHPGETKKVGTGLAMHIKSANHAGFIYARSGLATKDGLRPANCVGVVDSDYQGEWIIALHNDSDVRREIKVGDRIAQAVIAPVTRANFDEVKRFSEETARAQGGFGSTGK